MPSCEIHRHWARFIPKEEVAKVTQWNFGDVSSPWTPDELAQRQADEASAQQQLLLAQEDSYTRGYNQGHAEGLGQAERLRDDYAADQGAALVQSNTERMGQLLGRLGDGLALAQEHMTQGVLQLACAVAQQLVRRELRTEPDLVKHVVREALDTLAADGKPATVRLSPADVLLFQELSFEYGRGVQVTLLEDATLQPGECLVDVAGARIDGRWEPRWQRAVGALGLAPAAEVPWQPMTDAPSPPSPPSPPAAQDAP